MNELDLQILKEALEVLQCDRENTVAARVELAKIIEEWS